MPAYTTKMVRREAVARETYAFHFNKPDGFAFEAGQYVSLRLIDPPETDDEGTSRSFTIASAPHEPGLMIATRIRNTAMKRVLRTMPIGADVRITGPFGAFTLDPDSARPAVLLAGGIGITPFRSMVLDAAHRRLARRVLLFCSNRSPEDAPFLEELRQLESRNPNYRLVATMTRIEGDSTSWEGERGLFDKPMLQRYVKDLSEPVYYVVGPPRMVKGVREMLLQSGIDAARIRDEEFEGY